MSAIDHIAEAAKSLGEAVVQEMLSWPAYKGTVEGDDDYPEAPVSAEDYREVPGDHVAAAALNVIAELLAEIQSLQDDRF